MDDLISRQAAIDACKHAWTKDLEPSQYIEILPSAQPEQHGRVFKEIVVEYLSYNTYQEYKGKPYFSIKYTENGQGFIGYGTYKPEVLSEYLKEYFMPSAQPEQRKGYWFDVGSLSCRCSECGGKSNRESRYCPNCGAKMEVDYNA